MLVKCDIGATLPITIQEFYGSKYAAEWSRKSIIQEWD